MLHKSNKHLTIASNLLHANFIGLLEAADFKKVSTYVRKNTGKKLAIVNQRTRLVQKKVWIADFRISLCQELRFFSLILVKEFFKKLPASKKITI